MEAKEYEARLSKLREEIDAIDGELLPLFLRRMGCSAQVAQLKGEAGMPVFSPQREQAILDKVRARGGEDGDAAAALYSSIMAISRAKQHLLLHGGASLRQLEATAARTLPLEGARVVCQGVQGAFSHKAALEFFGDISPAFVPTWKEAFEEVAAGKADYAVLPVENSAAGSVTGVYDLILRYRFYIVGAVDVKVEHCLAAGKATGAPTAAVSHPQALSQCSEYLEAHGLRPIQWSNTAAAARYVAQEAPAGVAAICSQEAAREYGLTILEESIQNEAENTTRFILISREAIEPIQAVKVNHLGSVNPRLHSDEILIALAISATTNPLARRALEQLSTLRGCEAHSTVILSPADTGTYSRLGLRLTCEPQYQSKKLYHK